MTDSTPPRPFGGRVTDGVERPALLIIDMSEAFTDPQSPLGCDLEAAIAVTARLLDAARAAKLPIMFTTVAYDGPADHQKASVFLQKIPALNALQKGSDWTRIDHRIEPRTASGEHLITKQFASAFFQTPLSELLVAQRCDSIILAGASTSGCVRATAVDGVQNGYAVMVVRDAVGDRNTLAHEQALHDMDARYGDVGSSEEAVQLIGRAGRHRLD